MSVKVFTYEEYSQIVNRRLNWNHALVAFDEASMANNAGYSTLSSNISTSSNSFTNFDASGNVGTTYGNVYGNVNTLSNSNTQINTKLYNGSAHYNAMQHASRNTAGYRENQTRQKESLNEGYFKINTVFGNERVFGQFNIDCKEATELFIIVPINGLSFGFRYKL